MAEKIIIPHMGESITEASVASFLKPSGSFVAENEEIIELETEKVNQVLYAPCNGVITWSVQEGEAFPIGATLGEIEPKESAPPREEKKEEPPPAPAKVTQKEGGIREGVAHMIESLEEKPTPPPAAPAPEKPKEEGRETREKMSKIRKTIARRLVESLHQSAMLTTFNEVDMSAIVGLRTKYKEEFLKRHGVKLGFMGFFVKATVEALKEFPDLNAYIDGDEIVRRNYFDLGIAVGTEKGLVVPVVRDCDSKSLAQIERAIVELATKAREGKLAIADLEGGGFTITNGGVYGSLLSTPILNPPQVGILGMHKIQERPVAKNKDIYIAPMMNLALSYDHRIVDGKEAVSFLVRMVEILEDPARLLLFEGGV